jgi:type I restriction enzyme M protein
MPKSLGNKRNKLGDPADRQSEPDQIADITRLFGSFTEGETIAFSEEDPITKLPVEKLRVVSKVFDNADFGFHKITVERPLRLNFQATPERIVRLETESGFTSLVTSVKKNEKARLDDIEAGKRRQDDIRKILEPTAPPRLMPARAPRSGRCRAPPWARTNPRLNRRQSTNSTSALPGR